MPLINFMCEIINSICCSHKSQRQSTCFPFVASSGKMSAWLAMVNVFVWSPMLIILIGIYFLCNPRNTRTCDDPQCSNVIFTVIIWLPVQCVDDTVIFFFMCVFMIMHNIICFFGLFILWSIHDHVQQFVLFYFLQSMPMSMLCVWSINFLILQMTAPFLLQVIRYYKLRSFYRKCVRMAWYNHC